MKTKASVNKGVIFWLLYLSYVAIYMARQNLSMASPALQDAGLLTAAQLGFIGSVFSVLYSCGRLFNGILGDRIASKILIITGLAFSGVANLLIGFLRAASSRRWIPSRTMPARPGSCWAANRSASGTSTPVSSAW